MRPLSLARTASLLTVIAFIFGRTTHAHDATSAGHHQNPIYSRLFNSMNGALHKGEDAFVDLNGMTLSLASLPEGTLLYHGSTRSEPVTGAEALAFDPESSLTFARKRPGRHEGGADDGDGQRGGEPGSGFLAGWLHTYKTVKELNLVWIDGRSATDSQSVTLDPFDRILMGLEGEHKRAEAVCKFSEEHWDRRVYGVIRLGGDFEIVLCSPQQMLERVRIVRVVPAGSSSQEHGVIEQVPDYLVCSYAYGINLPNYTDNEDGDRSPYRHGYTGGNPDYTWQPRLKHIPSDAAEPIRDDDNKFILNYGIPSQQYWRAVTGMVIGRYASEIDYIASGALETREQLHGRVLHLLAPFIDYKARDKELEIERCATDYLPGAVIKESLPYRAVYSVTRRICATLQESLHDKRVDSIVERMKRLKEFLQWAVWKS
ncbi:hypothetical protein NKR23_g9520 [Pleurostoma richardsiae]|uniref:Uncharacterized protein n=1 Tax=Pleurostoma richardsiae TaxID=41990 RepID=A0AA38RH04_9PEZI|nr:hypothetical protein NKR23_g9520 [Pleurostoma richardsiae]